MMYSSTLPSSLEAPSRFAMPDEPVPSISDDQLDTPGPKRTSALSPAYSPAVTSRPALRHSNSSHGNLENSPSQSGRNRSGSLTLPKNGIGSAFGASAFSNTWLANPSQSRSPLGHLQQEEDPSVFASSDSAASIDLNFSTLDYLGLEEGNDLPPASMFELRNQAQRAIANSGPASRLRASTVSNFARPFRPSVINNPLNQNRDLYAEHDQEDLIGEMNNLSMHDGHEGMYGAAGGYGVQGTIKDPHRPRATTIGGLQDGRRGAHAGYLSSIPQSPVQANMFQPQGLSAGYNYPPRTRSGTEISRSRDSSQSRGPRMAAFSTHPSRAGTPDVAGSSTPQVPTRSLWIGNLDVSATSAALLHVFAPYGAIESVRMLPEKVSAHEGGIHCIADLSQTCAFVNFMEKGDAIRARDDVLNRMGGHVSALSETAPVRIGFGKIDAVPANGPANGSSHRSTPSFSAPMLPTTTGSVIPPVPPLPPNLVAAPPIVAGSPEQGSEISTMPTRALWIGSIPGTTSSATLLQIFSPFGPVESARVLMHKVSSRRWT